MRHSHPTIFSISIRSILTFIFLSVSVQLFTCEQINGLSSVLVLAIQKWCGQAGEGLEKDHKYGQRTGKADVRGKAERTRLVQP